MLFKLFSNHIFFDKDGVPKVTDFERYHKFQNSAMRALLIWFALVVALPMIATRIFGEVAEWAVPLAWGGYIVIATLANIGMAIYSRKRYKTVPTDLFIDDRAHGKLVFGNKLWFVTFSLLTVIFPCVYIYLNFLA